MWRMRYYYAKVSGQKKAETSALDISGPGDAATAVQNLMHNAKITRIDIVSGEYEHDREPVKAKRLEWWQDHSYPKGERWEGTLGGKLVATIVHHSAGYGGGCHYSTHLGQFSTEYTDVSSIDSGKRAAQRALNKVVQALVGEG
jgi:hypothetical protein